MVQLHAEIRKMIVVKDFKQISCIIFNTNLKFSTLLEAVNASVRNIPYASSIAHEWILPTLHWEVYQQWTQVHKNGQFSRVIIVMELVLVGSILAY